MSAAASMNVGVSLSIGVSPGVGLHMSVDVDVSVIVAVAVIWTRITDGKGGNEDANGISLNGPYAGGRAAHPMMESRLSPRTPNPVTRDVTVPVSFCTRSQF